MLTVLKISDSKAYNISDAQSMYIQDNRLIIIDRDGYKMVDYALQLSEEYSKRFFDIFLGNLSIGNYIDIEKLLKYNFKDVILKTRERQEDGEC